MLLCRGVGKPHITSPIDFSVFFRRPYLSISSTNLFSMRLENYTVYTNRTCTKKEALLGGLGAWRLEVFVASPSQDRRSFTEVSDIRSDV